MTATPHHELRLYGHRGASSRLPENTLPAFAAALDDGADSLELDIHRTADGHFVVAHDPDGARMARVDRKIREINLRDIREWNAASGFPGSELARIPIPTLSEVLTAFPGVPMCVDLKPADPDAVPSLLEEVARHGAENHVTLASFNMRVVKRIRRLGYRGRTALSRLEVAFLRFLPEVLAKRFVAGDAVHVPVAHGAIRLDDDAFICRCRRLGLRLDYWVVNDPNEARRLLDSGATGIMTDDPALIAPVVSGYRPPRE